ncbi:unnamed protein product [Cuscuta epithymum]|uniref:Retrotransposon Copia-like N-terminal domain-containing protein n=1 Tax=Cuscuta epithymum TaxID=186058 RepID=A0AAV0FGN7_9ASTE|nr:unnamed protein product [Cuscuta epithymum]
MTIPAATAVIPLTASANFPIKLTASNFPVWKCQVHAALVGLGLEGYVDGTITAPDQFTDAAKTQLNPCYITWYRQDKTILSALLGSCSDTIQPIISSTTTSRNAWDKLALTYANTSRGRIIFLKSTLAKTTKGDKSVMEYLTIMNKIADDLALAQSPTSEEDLIVSILNGLGPDYHDITSAIRVRETPLPLSQLQSILEERERKLQNAPAPTSILLPTANATMLSDRMHHSSSSGDRRPNYANDRRGSAPRRGRGGYSHHQTRHSSFSLQEFRKLVTEFSGGNRSDSIY